MKLGYSHRAALATAITVLASCGSTRTTCDLHSQRARAGELVSSVASLLVALPELGIIPHGLNLIVGPISDYGAAGLPDYPGRLRDIDLAKELSNRSVGSLPYSRLADHSRLPDRALQLSGQLRQVSETRCKLYLVLIDRRSGRLLWEHKSLIDLEPSQPALGVMSAVIRPASD